MNVLLRNEAINASDQAVRHFNLLGSDQALEALLLPSSRPSCASAWHGHVGFAHWLVQALMPGIVVELGTQNGVSYAAFCRAVKSFRYETRCFAVDTWQGDAHTGEYSDSVFDNVQQYNAEHFASFSTLIRSTFVEALARFENGSIDLLHIDGLHTYEAVKADFEAWLPKMSGRGVILFHDTSVRLETFGVWRLWDELTKQYPSFLFEHSAGLGVLAVGLTVPNRVLALCEIKNNQEVASIRNDFEYVSDRATRVGVELETRLKHVTPGIECASESRPSVTNAVMRGWVNEQVAPWLLNKLKIESWQDLDDLNAKEPAVFVFDIFDGQVKVFDKPEDARSGLYDFYFDRANCYQQYFSVVIKQLPPTFRTRLAIFVADGAMEHPKIPIFGFQKPRGHTAILLPDPDMIGHGFPSANDVTPFRDKLCRAIFVGATTGGIPPITSENVVYDGATPRIRAAEYFRSVEGVVFKLPVIVQCDSPDTIKLLTSMGYGDEHRISWEEQLQNKFIISMDGNGATCTRVTISLGSNSVLLKYDSDSVLYYFSGLQPWVHYIPIADHADILHILDIERKTPGFFGFTLQASRHFVSDFLSSSATAFYTAQLLLTYAEHLAAAPPERASSSETQLEVCAHVQNHGDTRVTSGEWAGLPGSSCFIEGFSIRASGAIKLDDISYYCINEDGEPLEKVAGGCFAGSFGQHKPIYGICISLKRELHERWHLCCWARYCDGQEVGPVESGVPCVQLNRVPLEAFRLVLRDRMTAAKSEGHRQTKLLALPWLRNTEAP